LSKIFRSLDIDKSKVADIDLRGSQMGPQNPTRPLGGFFELGQDNPSQEYLTAFEQREREARRIVDEAMHQAEVIQRDAYHAGFEQGERAGEKLAHQKIEPTIHTFQAVIDAISQDRQTLILQHEQDLIKVAFAIAQQVIRATVKFNPDVVKEIVESALGKVAKSQRVVLFVSPYDRQMIEQYMRKREGGDWPPEHLTIQTDDTIARGGCRVETDTGDIDATIETQLRVLREMLWDE